MKRRQTLPEAPLKVVAEKTFGGSMAEKMISSVIILVLMFTSFFFPSSYELMLPRNIVGGNSEVRLVRANSTFVEVESGAVTFMYKLGDAVRIVPSWNKSVWVETKGLCGASYDFSSHASSMTVDTNKAMIDITLRGKQTDDVPFIMHIISYTDHPGVIRLHIAVNVTTDTHFIGVSHPFSHNLWVFYGKSSDYSDPPSGQGNSSAVLRTLNGPIAINSTIKGKTAFYMAYLTGPGMSTIKLTGGLKYGLDERRYTSGVLTPLNLTVPKGTWVFLDMVVSLSPPDTDIILLISRIMEFASEFWFSIPNQVLEEISDYDLRLLEDLASSNPLIWIRNGDNYYLRAYVDDSRDLTELITTTDVLFGSLLHYRLFQDEHSKVVIDRIMRSTNNLSIWFSERFNHFLNDYIPTERVVDFGHHDAWYLLDHASMLLNAMLLGLRFNVTQVKLELDALVLGATNSKYDFPVFFYPDMRPLSGYERDSALYYAYDMILAYRIFNDETYLSEAKRALNHYFSSYPQYIYEIHSQAAGIAALAWLHKMTENKTYLGWIGTSFRNLLAASRVVKDPYGQQNLYAPVGLVEAMPLLRYYAPHEYGHAYYFLFQASTILGENPYDGLFLFYLTTIPYSATFAFPAVLGKWSNTTSYARKVYPDLWVPFEDYRGFELNSGNIGQEIYGAGSQLIAVSLWKGLLRETVDLPPVFTKQKHIPIMYISSMRMSLHELANGLYAPLAGNVLQILEYTPLHLKLNCSEGYIMVPLWNKDITNITVNGQTSTFEYLPYDMVKIHTTSDSTVNVYFSEVPPPRGFPTNEVVVGVGLAVIVILIAFIMIRKKKWTLKYRKEKGSTISVTLKRLGNYASFRSMTGA